MTWSGRSAAALPGKGERWEMQFKQAGFLTKIVVLVLLIYMTTSLIDMLGQIQDVESQRDALAQEVSEYQLENQELGEYIANSDDPDVLEQAARDRGYVKENEDLYVDIAN